MKRENRKKEEEKKTGEKNGWRKSGGTEQGPAPVLTPSLSLPPFLSNEGEVSSLLGIHGEKGHQGQAGSPQAQGQLN